MPSGTFFSGFGMVIVADEVPALTSPLNLSVVGASLSGMYGGVDLHTYSDADGMSRSGLFPVTLVGADSDSITGGMNLWTEGGTRPASARVDLVTWNDQSGVASPVNLFIAGQGENAGYFPVASGLNMTLARDPAAALLLLIGAPGFPSASGFPLAIHGGGSSSSGLPISISSVVGTVSGPTKLYVSGY